MKKKTLILGIHIILLQALAFSQNADSLHQKRKKLKFFAATVKTLDGKKEKGALSRFSGDSIYIFPLNFLNRIKPDEEFGIPASNIDIVRLVPERSIKVPDTLKLKFQAPPGGRTAMDLASAIDLADLTFTTAPDPALVSMPGDYSFVAGVSIMFDVIGILSHLDSIRRFKINGDKLKFRQMIILLLIPQKNPEIEKENSEYE